MALPKGVGLGLHWAWVPFWGFIFGCATIISLLVIWLAQGHPRYKQDEATVVYISDVGADNHALFIVLGTLTALLFFASIFLDYRLRHTARIPQRVRRIERVSAALSVIFAFLCALGCILLTIFDAFRHQTLHWTFSGIYLSCLPACVLPNTEVSDIIVYVCNVLPINAKVFVEMLAASIMHISNLVS